MDKAGARQNRAGERLAFVPTPDDDPDLMAKGQAGEKSFFGPLIPSTVFCPFSAREP